MSHKHKTLIAFQFLKITSSTDSFTYENPCKFLIIFFFSKVLIFLTGSMCLFSPISNVLITVIKNRLCNKQHEKCFNHEIVSVQTPHNTTYPIDSFPWTKRSTLQRLGYYCSLRCTPQNGDVCLPESIFHRQMNHCAPSSCMCSCLQFHFIRWWMMWKSAKQLCNADDTENSEQGAFCCKLDELNRILMKGKAAPTHLKLRYSILFWTFRMAFYFYIERKKLNTGKKHQKKFAFRAFTNRWSDMICCILLHIINNTRLWITLKCSR